MANVGTDGTIYFSPGRRVTIAFVPSQNECLQTQITTVEANSLRTLVTLPPEDTLFLEAINIRCGITECGLCVKKFQIRGSHTISGDAELSSQKSIGAERCANSKE